MRYYLLFVVIVSFLSFQNCSNSGFPSLKDSSQGLSSSQFVGMSSSNLGVEGSKSINLLLMADGDLVSSGMVVEASVSGEIVLTWRGLNSPVSCSILGQVASVEGGPKVFKNVSDGDYSFVCLYASGDTAILPFKVKKRLSASKPLVEKFPVDVFLVAGQSNAVGQRVDDQEYKPPTTPVLRFENGVLQDTNELGAWAFFGRVYNSLTKRAIVFIPASVPGTGTNKVSDRGNGHWGADGTLLETSLNKLRQASIVLERQGYSPQFSGILWVQGENDAIRINEGVMNGSDYREGLTSIIRRYRENLGTQTPFYIFQTGTAVGESDIGYAIIRKIQNEVVGLNVYNKMVYEKAITFPSRHLMWDVYHYMPAGYREMGSEGAKAVVQFINSLPKAISVSAFTGSSSNNLQSLKNDSVLRPDDLLKIVIAKATLSASGSTSFILSIHDVNYAAAPVENGPYQSDLEGTLAGFQFISGRKYIIQAKGCNANNLCGPLSSPISFSVANPSECKSGGLISQACNPPPNVLCSVSTADGKSKYTLSEDVTLSLVVPSSYVAIGQRNRVYDKGTLIADHPQIVEWGGNGAKVTYTSKDLNFYIGPFLQSRSSATVVYELMKKSANGNWEPCGNTFSLTWSK